MIIDAVHHHTDAGARSLAGAIGHDALLEGHAVGPPRRSPDHVDAHIDPQPLENAADQGCSHAVTEREQLALDSLVAPAGILAGHALDQHGHSIIDRWTPEVVRICPLPGDEAPMPAQDRVRRDQAMPTQQLRPSLDEHSEDRSIRPVQVRLRVGPA
jgi:hypothetical protein